MERITCEPFPGVERWSISRYFIAVQKVLEVNDPSFLSSPTLFHPGAFRNASCAFDRGWRAEEQFSNQSSIVALQLDLTRQM